jgi:hypothetical protein
METRLLMVLGCAAALVACGPVQSSGADGAVDSAVDAPLDAVAAVVLCTTTACAAQPCTAGCAFTALPAGGCIGVNPAAVARAQVAACPGFCGLFAGDPTLGCRRFKIEDQACSTDCHLDGAEQCYPFEFDLDWKTGGAICDTSAHYFCKSSEPADMSRGVCLDSGMWQ